MNSRRRRGCNIRHRNRNLVRVREGTIITTINHCTRGKSRIRTIIFNSSCSNVVLSPSRVNDSLSLKTPSGGNISIPSVKLMELEVTCVNGRLAIGVQISTKIDGFNIAAGGD